MTANRRKSAWPITFLILFLLFVAHEQMNSRLTLIRIKFNDPNSSTKLPNNESLAVVIATARSKVTSSEELETKCVIWVYDMKKYNSSDCQVLFVLTQEPLRQTEATAPPSNISILLIDHPLDYILSEYETHYQTKFSRQVTNSQHFQSYALAKALQWRMHAQLWHSRDLNIKVVFHSRALSTNLLSLNSLIPDKYRGNSMKFDLKFLNNPRNSKARNYLPLGLRSLIFLHTMPQLCVYEMEGRDPSQCSKILPSYHEKLSSLQIWWDKPFKRKVNILTTYYRSKQPLRRIELDYVFDSNLSNENVDRVHILTNNATELPYNHLKLLVSELAHQPMYSDYLEYANSHLIGQIVIIQNSDVFWTNQSLRQIHALKPGKIFALSRHSNVPSLALTNCRSITRHNNNLCLNYIASHDAFAFIAPLDPQIIRHLVFKQNTWGVENVLIEAFRYSGYDVYNPCLELRLYHAHCSKHRGATGHRILPPDQGNRSFRHWSIARPILLKKLVI